MKTEDIFNLPERKNVIATRDIHAPLRLRVQSHDLWTKKIEEMSRFDTIFLSVVYFQGGSGHDDTHEYRLLASPFRIENASDAHKNTQQGNTVLCLFVEDVFGPLFELSKITYDGRSVLIIHDMAKASIERVRFCFANILVNSGFKVTLVNYYDEGQKDVEIDGTLPYDEVVKKEEEAGEAWAEAMKKLSNRIKAEQGKS